MQSTVPVAPLPAKVPPPTPTTRYSWRNGLTQQLYITDVKQAEASLSTFNGPCGLDIEWKPNFRKGQPENPVALLQLANSGTVLLLHLCHMTHFPKNLQAFLENPNIVKAGVGIQGDAKKLFNDCRVNIRNCVDLSLLAKSVDNRRWKGKYREPIGLARLIATYEDRLLPKGKITRSNWENFLDSEQQEYSHAGYTLYMRLSTMIPTMPKVPHATCYSFDVIRGRACEPSGMTWSPFNPDYDPGPPPPKPAPRTDLATSGATQHASAASGSHENPAPLKRRLTHDTTTSTQPSSSTTPDSAAEEDSCPTTKRRKRRRPYPNARNNKSLRGLRVSTQFRSWVSDFSHTLGTHSFCITAPCGIIATSSRTTLFSICTPS
ncbi:ribonuclease H-like domain-containing protein [Mycena sp. CBHHK59/15]|nr:ribonuclease H-like domain-containing protein [Mycena sp. CBHHK59/15]